MARREDSPAAMTVGPVTLDGIVPGVLAQYDPRMRWNGWLCPSLDPLGVVTVLEAIIAHSADDPAFAYEFRDDVLFIEDLNDPARPVDSYEPDEDGLYPLGTHAWIWSAAEDAEPQPRHLHIVPAPRAIVCMYADTGQGSCGGQTTTIGDGFDYCQNHSSLRFGSF